ncbi:hypothetical protein BKA61DRAFT_723601 [Leptodontidium sp. MPI-SDFR-AT-0119]|nr:hypothetical protein BKA61DRAFT_723601 [Leptodontidium sp. MPI-SDFR-AT-0119]
MLIFDHYPQFEFLLESGLTCGLCYLFIYSLKHETGDLKVSYNEFLNPLLELSAMRRMKDLPTPIQVVFVFDHDSKETILPNSHSFQITCGIEDGPQWAGPSICWSPIADVEKVPPIKDYYLDAQPSIKTVLAWIKYCDDNHSVCAKHHCQNEWHTLPSRVIDVGAPNSMREPYLVISNGERAPYEAAAMASIYKNCFVTIAATASKDSKGGCFRPRKPFTLLRRPQVEPSESSDTLLLYPDSMRTLEYMLNAPLNKRGWTFQEQALSCRTLNFCEDQLLWHCLERITTEDGVVDFPGYKPEHDSAERFYAKLGTKVGLIKDLNEVVTQPLSGVIAEFQELTGSKPIALLWNNDLPYGLLWRCASRSMKRPEVLSKIPTWSWVSLDGPIVNDLRDHTRLTYQQRTVIEVHIDIITASVSHSRLVPTSPIMGGTISLYGRLQPATRSREDRTRGLFTEVRDEDISFFRLLAPQPCISLDMQHLHIGWCIFDQEAPPPDQVIWCLEISISERTSESSIDPFEEVPAPANTHDVLILEPEENSDEKFRRIGVGAIHVGRETFQHERRLVSIV